MSNTWSIEVDSAGCINQLIKAIHGHVANLKNALRAVENGSFEHHVRARSPRSVMQLQVMEDAIFPSDVARRAAVTCFKEIVSEFISFLDRLITTKRMVEGGRVVVERSLIGEDEFKAYLVERFEQKYLDVARDRKLTNPAKLAELGVSSDLSSVAMSFFTLRRCVEHHGGVPDSDITLHFKRPTVSIKGKEILRLPQPVDAGETITVNFIDDRKILPRGQKVMLVERDIDHIAMTIQLIARELLATGVG